ncbi:MAG TPA: 7-carboxy-7-deazaguanine synthase QueE [Candidatus Omnitrophota bacterium]|jgi:organic radical activating enzyme|nr:7-carboxy-7-deazaguanine synthase QueE [Candidatus Omnitrophota bacterium]
MMKNRTAPVTEIFSSLQGEGPYAGVKQVFVRFYDCNMRCRWCDTPQSLPEHAARPPEQDTQQVFQQVVSLWGHCHSVSLTGGEPLLQAPFLQNLLPRFRKSGMPVYLDTNGILFAELEAVIPDVDIIAMDIKLPSSTGEREYWREHEQFLHIAQNRPVQVFIKTVVSRTTDKADMIKAAELIARQDAGLLMVIQPCSQDREAGALERCLEYQDCCLEIISNVRVLPQWHTLMNLR